FNTHVSLASFSLYFLLFGQKQDLFTSIHRKAMIALDLDDLGVWICAWYQPYICIYNLGNYVYIQQTMPTTLMDGVGFKNLDSKGSKGHIMDGSCAQLCTCHLPNIDGKVDPNLANLFACGVATMLVCNQCSKGWHMQCLTPLLEMVPKGDWLCL
ncbi:hypothetical protein BDL97_17G063300, partial [Sphagnum fallax]